MNFKNYKSIATLSLSGTLWEKLEAIANAGFYGVEICENDISSVTESPRQIMQIANDLGLKILLFQPFRDFEGCPRQERKENLARAKHKFELMTQLGVDNMLLCSNVSANTIKDDAVIVEDLRLLAEHANEYEVKIGFEALSWGIYVNSYSHAWDIVQKVDHPSCGIILDSFHTLATNETLLNLEKIAVEKIFFVQLADAPYLNTDLLKWSRHFRCYPGNGELNVSNFVSELLKLGYTGPLSLEIFSDSLRALSPRIAAFDGMLAMRHLEHSVLYN